MLNVYVNFIATAVPPYDIHQKFVDYAPSLLKDERSQALFKRMAERSQIEHRYSFFKPNSQTHLLDVDNFYAENTFPDTKARMKFYERHAFSLAQQALDQLDLQSRKETITHLILTTCTGFYAPGLDLQIVEHYGLKDSVERSIIGFMGCYAAINALKLARHIVRSEKNAQVLILNLELCTLHLQNTDRMEDVLSFLIFSDGCAASIVSAEKKGIELQNFYSTIVPESNDQITWHIGEFGFDMSLSGHIPSTITAALPQRLTAILGGRKSDDFLYWAIHPGGRTVLDAVQEGAQLPEVSLTYSRDVLRRFGNMSSATVMFVLKEMMQPGNPPGAGCAMAFGPGVTVESMLFQKLDA